MRDPGVDRHVREDAGPVEEARLRPDEEERPLGDERQEEEARRRSRRARTPRSRAVSVRTAFKRPARDPLHAGEQVAEDEAARREGERDAM